MIPTVGEPVLCNACGGVYEGPVTFVENGEVSVLRGHVQGDKVCKERQSVVTVKHRKPADQAPVPSLREMTAEQRAQREEAVRAALKGSGWRE